MNPTYNGETVKTQFAINIPRAAGADKRMTPENTQNGTSVSFLGMDNIYLMAMNNGNDEISTASVISDVFNLPAIGNAEISTSNGQKIYKDIAIPVGTTDFLFYGQAPAASTGSDLEKNFARGVLNGTFPTAGATGATPANVKFSLQTIATSYHANSTLLAQLNAVAGAKATSDASKTWAETDDESLKALYTAFTGLKAGSANAIKATLEDLYNAVAPITADDNTNYTDEIATAIKKAITGTSGLFNADETPKGSGTYTLSWKSADNSTFPTELGLPEGAVKLDFTSTSGQFSYMDTGIQIGGTPNVDVNSITYPARLTYYAATPLKANNAVVDTWGWNSNWDGWDNEVLASTRSIALQNKINYGVAALETTVKFKANTIGDSKDGHIINIGADDFALTGILVGGQPKEVLYNMEPATGQAGQFTQTVWDCDMPETGMDIPIASGNTTANYTLLLDDKNKTNKTVQFALELQNNGTSTIYGQGGIIKPGMKFYLVGQLDPTTGTGNATAPDPADGNVDHVFIKDYLTKANVTISSFQNAYVTIPDLRSTQLQLGLYVDLTWQKGYTFNVEIGEN